jgi:hypothetical protein
MMPVTKPFLQRIEEYQRYLEDIGPLNAQLRSVKDALTKKKND